MGAALYFPQCKIKCVRGESPQAAIVRVHAAGGCSVEVQSIPSLAIFEISQPKGQWEQAQLNPQQLNDHGADSLQQKQQRHASVHDLNDQQQAQRMQNERQHAHTIPHEDASSPEKDTGIKSKVHAQGARCTEPRSRAPQLNNPILSPSDDGSKHFHSAMAGPTNAAKMQQVGTQGNGQRLTAMEQLLASLPDIDIATSPDQSQHSSDRAQRPIPGHTEQTTKNLLAVQTQQQHGSREAQSSYQQPSEALDKEAAGDERHSGSELTHAPPSALYAQPTQKELRREKRKGVLVPQVDTAVQACRVRVSPGIAAIQPSPGSPSLDALARAIEGLSRVPLSASSSRPAETGKSKAHTSNAASVGRPRAGKKDAMPQSKASKQSTTFIADLQMDLAARVLAKQPKLAHEQQLSNILQRDVLLSPQQRQQLAAAGISGVQSRAIRQQAMSPSSIFQAAAKAAPRDRGVSAVLAYAAPSEHRTRPFTAEPDTMQRSQISEAVAAPFLSASTPAFIGGPGHPSGRSPIMERTGQQTINLQALMNAMAASEHTAAALEQQLTAAHQRIPGIPSDAAGLLTMQAEQQNVPVQTVRGTLIDLQAPCPGSSPSRASELQRQLIAQYIDAGVILQGRPITAPSLHGQETGQRQAESGRLPSQERQITEDALSAALQTLRQQSQHYATEASQRHVYGRQATQAVNLQAGMQEAEAHQEYPLSLAMQSQAEAVIAFGSPAQLPFSGSLPGTPMAEDAFLSRLWHTSGKKRYSFC